MRSFDIQGYTCDQGNPNESLQGLSLNTGEGTHIASLARLGLICEARERVHKADQCLGEFSGLYSFAGGNAELQVFKSQAGVPSDWIAAGTTSAQA